MKNPLGEYSAEVLGNLVATGKSYFGVYKKAKEKYPKELITLSYIPHKKDFPHWLSNFEIMRRK